MCPKSSRCAPGTICNRPIRLRILAIDTTQTPGSLALLQPGAPPLWRCLAADRPVAEYLVPEIGQLMDEAGLGFAALDRIAAAAGPGPFIALRAGIAAARALALACRRPACGVPSLLARAALAACAHPGLAIFAALPLAPVRAGRAAFAGQVFSADLAPQTPPRLFAGPDLARHAPPGRFVLAAGPALQACLPAPARGPIHTQKQPLALAVGRCAHNRPAPARPIYPQPAAALSPGAESL